MYVYDTSGGVQGSLDRWHALVHAQVEGVATDGSDIWIVDNKSDKVYRYANAASRLSGSQNAASSFALNSGNTNPKGIVTDGTYLWVVNDSFVRQNLQVHAWRQLSGKLDDRLR